MAWILQMPHKGVIDLEMIMNVTRKGKTISIEQIKVPLLFWLYKIIMIQEKVKQRAKPLLGNN